MRTRLEFKKNLSEDKKKLIIFVSGEIDSTNYDLFDKFLLKQLDQLNIIIDEIVFDLGSCILISSNGLGIFYKFKDIIYKRNKEIILTLININKKMFEVIKILKMDEYFNVK